MASVDITGFIEAVIVIVGTHVALEEVALTEDMVTVMDITVDIDQTDILAATAIQIITDITATTIEETPTLVLFSLQEAVNFGIKT